MANEKLTRKDYKELLTKDNSIKKKDKLKKVWKKNYHLFNVIADKNLSKNQRKCIIKTMEPNQVNGMGKIINDLLYTKRSPTVPEKEIKELKKMINILKQMSAKKLDNKKRKNIMIKYGGIFPFLLPLAMKVAAPLIGAVASTVVGKAFKK